MFAYVVKFRIFKGRAYPALYSWALDAITCVLTTEREIRLRNTKEDINREKEEAICPWPL